MAARVGIGAAVSSPFVGNAAEMTRKKSRIPAGLRTRPRRVPVRAGLGEAFLGVGVGLPCTVMQCGDMIYRSTLPKADGITLTVPGAVLALTALSYLWATPGVAPGFFDMFFLAFIDRFSRPTYKKDDVVIGKKLGEGAFGVVYRASLAKKPSSSKKGGELVLKKATEYGAVEIWMNERVRRACANSCADFIYGFREASSKKSPEYWLLWRFEGEVTLADLMQSKDFPYNVETMILGEVQDLPKGIERENKIIQTIMRQLLFALDGLHSTGIVHRDIKPQNIIFSEGSRTFKIIDLGAAADLRVGINYIPKEFLLDPRYAAPEQYIMSTQTPSAPSAPVATALSPVLWQMNLPDRFDIYSTGLIFLQMAFAGVRTDSSLIQLKRQLKRCEYDLVAWRAGAEGRATGDLRRGFEMMDLDGGIGWELLTSMVRFRARQRISAKAALAHPYFDREGLLALSVMQTLRLQLFRATQQDYSDAARWVVSLMAKSGTAKDGGFTEAQIQQFQHIEILNPQAMACQTMTMTSFTAMENESHERSPTTISTCNHYRPHFDPSFKAQVNARNLLKSSGFSRTRIRTMKHRWRVSFALNTDGLSESGSSNEESGGRTRLGRIVGAGGRQLLEKLRSARKNFPMKVFLVLLGFYTANALATILGQTGDWDVLVAGVVVAAIEGIGVLMYKKPPSLSTAKLQSFVEMVNFWKAGVCLGLFVDAFKLGS